MPQLKVEGLEATSTPPVQIDGRAITRPLPDGKQETVASWLEQLPDDDEARLRRTHAPEVKTSGS